MANIIMPDGTDAKTPSFAREVENTSDLTKVLDDGVQISLCSREMPEFADLFFDRVIDYFVRQEHGFESIVGTNFAHDVLDRIPLMYFMDPVADWWENDVKELIKTFTSINPQAGYQFRLDMGMRPYDSYVTNWHKDGFLVNHRLLCNYRGKATQWTGEDNVLRTYNDGADLKEHILLKDVDWYFQAKNEGTASIHIGGEDGLIHRCPRSMEKRMLLIVDQILVGGNLA